MRPEKLAPISEFGHKADAEAGADQAFHAVSAYIMAHNFRPVSRRDEFGINMS